MKRQNKNRQLCSNPNDVQLPIKSGVVISMPKASLGVEGVATQLLNLGL